MYEGEPTLYSRSGFLKPAISQYPKSIIFGF